MADLEHLTIELADGTLAVRLEDAQAARREAAHQAAQIGFTYGALGRDYEFVHKNVEDMLSAAATAPDGLPYPKTPDPGRKQR